MHASPSTCTEPSPVSSLYVKCCCYLLPGFLTDAGQVANSNEVNLGDDEDPEAIRAMIRHMYDLPYDQMLEDNNAGDTAAYSTNEDLLFQIGVFTAADKYDVATLRPLVVKKFEALMETNWESESFATSIQKLTGPSAGHLADNTLQAVAAAFCAKNLTKLVKKDKFVEMIQNEEPFTGRLLTGFITGFLKNEFESSTTIQLKCCNNANCQYASPLASSLQGLAHYCVVCGFARQLYGESRLVDYKKARLV